MNTLFSSCLFVFLLLLFVISTSIQIYMQQIIYVFVIIYSFIIIIIQQVAEEQIKNVVIFALFGGHSWFNSFFNDLKYCVGTKIT